MLTNRELERYGRQIMIERFGEEGQEKLKRAKVFIAGTGGLGSPISIYLALAGIGKMRIVDHESVALSNLNRQVLHWESDIGKRKVDSATEKLKKLNPGVKVEAIEETVTEANISQLVAGFDLIVDATDNFPTRYQLNKAALDHNIPLFHGGVYGFGGTATTIIPGETACLNCIYRGAAPPPETFPVIGVAPAVIAGIQATEVIKYILGIGKLLTNTLLIYDGVNLRFSEFRVKKDPNCEYCSHLARRG